MNKNFFEGVSICVFTFNYEKYLSQALDSILMQKTKFPIEIVIGDDFSSDNTRKIALEYKKNYPDIIVLSFNAKNVGGTSNWIKTINECNGKYISLIDGDDYFIDENKLQCQFDVLESNPEYTISIHSVSEIFDNMKGFDRDVEFPEDVFTLEDVFRKGWFMRTSSMFFRNGILPRNPPNWVYDFPYRYDTIIQVILCQYGSTVNIKQVMSVWRKHDRGMSYVLLEDFSKNAKKEIELIRRLNEHVGYKYQKQTDYYISRIYSEVFIKIIRKMDVFRYPDLFFQCSLKMNYKYTLTLLKNKIFGNSKIRLGQ